MSELTEGCGFRQNVLRMESGEMDVSIALLGDTQHAQAVALKVAEDQRELIATNEKSLNQAAKNTALIPLGIFLTGKMVGFAMYEHRDEGKSALHRFMIDAAWQRRGIGRRAMTAIVECMRDEGCRTLYLSFRPQNDGARALYEGLGFQFHEEEPDGELVYRLELE